MNTNERQQKPSGGGRCLTMLSLLMLLAAVVVGGYIAYNKELTGLDLTEIKNNINTMRRSKETADKYVTEVMVQTQELQTNVKQWKDNMDQALREQQKLTKTLQSELAALKRVPDVNGEILKLQTTTESLGEQVSASEATRQKRDQELTDSLQSMFTQLKKSEEYTDKGAADIKAGLQSLQGELNNLKNTADTDILQLKQDTASIQAQIRESNDKTDNSLRALAQTTETLGARLTDSNQFQNSAVAFSAKHRPATIETAANAVMGLLDITVNLGDAFDPATHKFTAPVAGVYCFSYSFQSSGGMIQLVIDGVSVSGTTGSQGSTSGTVSYTDVVNLQAEQKVWLEVLGQSGKISCSEKGSGCVFTGQLIAPL